MRLATKVTQNRFFQRALLFLLLTGLFAACSSAKKAKAYEKRVGTVIQTAKSYFGTPYKYGGTTRSGMDCSALTSTAYRSIDVKLPRSADAQSNVGTKVKKIKDVKEGDLVFFATGKKKREITHVGIVTDVKSKDNIKFIHASTSLGVVETNIYSDYFIKRYRTARRVLEEP